MNGVLGRNQKEMAVVTEQENATNLISVEKEMTVWEIVPLILMSVHQVICPQQIINANTSNSVHGGWGNWTKWTKCQFCGGGEQTRSRECDSPAPLYGGNKCTGPAEESQDCDNEPCVPGKQLVTNNNAVTSQLVIYYILYSVDYNLLCF